MSIKDFFPIDRWDFKSQSILADLPAEDFALLQVHQSEQSYSRGEVIFRQGAFPSGIFYIKKGKVKKYRLVEDGGQQIIYIANEGELIGYHAVLSDERFPDSAAALESCIVTFIPKEDFLEALGKSNILSKRLLKLLSHEFTVMVNGLTLFAQRSIRERLALQLIVLREKYKINFQPGMEVEINLSRDDLANLVGARRENIIRILSEFKELDVVETKGRKIIVKDVRRLIALANYK